MGVTVALYGGGSGLPFSHLFTLPCLCMLTSPHAAPHPPTHTPCSAPPSTHPHTLLLQAQVASSRSSVSSAAASMAPEKAAALQLVKDMYLQWQVGMAGLGWAGLSSKWQQQQQQQQQQQLQ